MSLLFRPSPRIRRAHVLLMTSLLLVAVACSDEAQRDLQRRALEAAGDVAAQRMAASGDSGADGKNHSRDFIDIPIEVRQLADNVWQARGVGNTQLIATDEGLRLYGAGIVSSNAESRFALEDPSPHRLGFDLRRIMRTRYRIDDFQQSYFVIDSFEDLLAQTTQTDFAPLYADLAALHDHDTDSILPGDRVLTRGTQAYARHKEEEPL